MKRNKFLSIGLCLSLVITMLIGNGRIMTRLTYENPDWYILMQDKIDFVPRLTNELNQEIESISTTYNIPQAYYQRIFTKLEVRLLINEKIISMLNFDGSGSLLDFLELTTETNEFLEKRIDRYLDGIVNVKIPVTSESLIELREELLNMLKPTLLPRNEFDQQFKSMKNYSMLLRECTKPYMIWCFIISLIIGLGGLILYHKNISKIIAAISVSCFIGSVIMNCMTVYFKKISVIKMMDFTYLIDELVYVSFNNLLDFGIFISKIMFVGGILLIAFSYGMKEYERVKSYANFN